MKAPLDLLIYRSKGDKNQTNGVFMVRDTRTGVIVFSRPCLERGWRQNRRNVSCIPVGTYPIEFEYSAKFQRHLWEVKDVPNRSEVKIHASNYWRQLEGCIAIGSWLRHINKDQYLDCAGSLTAVNDFHRVMKSFAKRPITKTTITIIER